LQQLQRFALLLHKREHHRPFLAVQSIHQRKQNNVDRCLHAAVNDAYRSVLAAVVGDGMSSCDDDDGHSWSTPSGTDKVNDDAVGDNEEELRKSAIQERS
jgi:hypothetical protein